MGLYVHLEVLHKRVCAVATIFWTGKHVRVLTSVEMDIETDQVLESFPAARPIKFVRSVGLMEDGMLFSASLM
jgi:hypothetical protein